MTRRKSRPLLPHEVASFRSSQESVDDATYSSFSMDESSQQQPWSRQSSFHMSQSSPEEVHTLPPSKASEQVTIPSNIPSIGQPQITTLGIAAEEAQAGIVTEGSERHIEASKKPSVIAAKRQSDPSPNPELPLLQGVPRKRGTSSISTRQNAPVSIYQEGRQDVSPSAMPCTAPSSVPRKASDRKSVPQALKRTSSLVRLSMSLDGKAKVTMGDESSPSPPRAQPLPVTGPTPRPKGGLQRSQSAMEPISKTPIDNILSFSMYSRRPMTGRSRDARSWEFYCDSDARDALTIQAEREQSGSAVGAIGLIRSRSNKTMAVNPNKRTAHQPKHESTKRQKSSSQQLQKPKLARAISSVARLQSVAGNAQKQAAKSKDKDLKSSSQPALYQSYDGDSDKENWEPGTQISSTRRRRPVNTEQQTGMRRPVLEESLYIPSHSSSLDTLMNRKAVKNRRIRSEESIETDNSSPEVAEEAAKLISGSSVNREVEDLDCVQNLLSLSQAAWQ